MHHFVIPHHTPPYYSEHLQFTLSDTGDARVLLIQEEGALPYTATVTHYFGGDPPYSDTEYELDLEPLVPNASPPEIPSPEASNESNQEFYLPGLSVDQVLGALPPLPPEIEAQLRHLWWLSFTPDRLRDLIDSIDQHSDQ